MSALLLSAALALLLASLTPWLPAWRNHLVDLPSHFPVQYVIGALLLFPASLFFHAPLAAATFAIAFCLNFFQLMPFLPRAPAAPAGKTFKILQSNVLKSNKDAESLRRLIEAEKPDIIACAEVTPLFAKMLDGLDYPHRLITPGVRDYGMAVLSRLPFSKMEKLNFGGARTEALIFRFEFDGRTIDAASLHPFTPLHNLRSRDDEFAALAERFGAEKPERLILMGDFNATPWCPAMKRLTKTLGLRYARQGFGVRASWPSILPFPFLRLPIDHVLVSANLGVAGFRLGPFIGSDHLPTVTTVYIANT